MLPIHPILTCAEARAWEAHLLGASTDAAWEAMRRAGTGLAAAVLRDFPQWRPLPRDPAVLALVGPGHNGGDALIALLEIVKARPRGRATVVLLEPAATLKPNSRRAWEELIAHANIDPLTPERFLARLHVGEKWDITLDGLYGLSFRPPLHEPAHGLIVALNHAPHATGFRAAVDVPSGLGDKPCDLAFQADFTYATGSVKAPLLAPENARWVGRIRYVDVGFFDKYYEAKRIHTEDFLLPCVLDPLRHLRPAISDKRDYGRLLIVSGSRSYPGAQMLNVLGALRAGAGLVTALAPASHAAAFAAVRPEAMWHACHEENDGGLGSAAMTAARDWWPRATAVLIGSGLGRGHATQAMIGTLVKECPLALVLDADALLPANMEALKQRPDSAGPVVLTPHAGEFTRLAGPGADLAAFCRSHKVITVLKGPVTRIGDGQRIWCSTFGGPVLARGGSGDVLAGIIGTLVARNPDEAFFAAARGVVWHGLAADALARARGETSALTAELPAHLPEALRAEWGE